MIPILFEYNETSFSTHGIGDLVDCIECKTSQNNEGEYELSFTYPVSGELLKELTIGRLVYAKANPWQENQIFRIYGYEKAINGGHFFEPGGYAPLAGLRQRKEGLRRYDVGVDANGFTPVPLEKIVRFFAESA